MENKPKIYISGKITGEDEKECRLKFKVAEQCLMGIFPNAEIINPMELPLMENADWSEYIMRDLGLIRDKAEMVYMLKDWVESDGARTEFFFARGCGKRIMFEIVHRHDIGHK